MNVAGTGGAGTQTGHRYLILALIGIFPLLVNGPVNARIAHLPFLYWSFEILIWVLVPALLLLATLRTPGFRLSDLGLHTAVSRYRGVPAVLAACLVFSPASYYVYAGSFDVFDPLFPDGGLFHYESVIPQAGPWRHVVILYFAVSAGLVEEFLFRGLLHRAAREFRRPTLCYLLASPALFSLIHWESGLANLLATWVYGLFMAAAFLLLRNLWPLIAGHVFTDLVWFD